MNTNHEEKATDLYAKYLLDFPLLDITTRQETELAVRCAMIAVDEILKALEAELLDLFDTARDCPINKKHTEFWIEVKKELEKI